MNSEDLIHNLDDHDDIDVRELFTILWESKKVIAGITSASTVAIIIVALSLPNIYTSSALLSPAEDQQSGSSMMSQVSGLASIAGMALPAQAADRHDEAIERVKSYEFFSQFFLPNILLQDLMAYSQWDAEKNTHLYDSSYNAKDDQWINAAPSAQTAFKTYKKIMNISQDKKSSFVSLSTKHQSPVIAQEWTQLIIDKINQSMRDDSKQRALKSVEYLNDQLQQTNYEQIKQAISGLQQQQIKSLMLIEANNDYIFKVLNAPIVPEFKSEPRRSLIVVFGALLGFMLSIFYALVMHFRKNS
jgi:LPS O-antigen subunit length determinant protein (WzzB/FepE family)